MWFPHYDELQCVESMKKSMLWNIQNPNTFGSSAFDFCPILKQLGFWKCLKTERFLSVFECWVIRLLLKSKTWDKRPDLFGYKQLFYLHLQWSSLVTSKIWTKTFRLRREKIVWKPNGHLFGFWHFPIFTCSDFSIPLFTIISFIILQLQLTLY